MTGVVYKPGASPLKPCTSSKGAETTGLIFSELLGSTWRNLALADDCGAAYISAIGACSPSLRSCKELPSPIAILCGTVEHSTFSRYFD